MPKIIGYLSRRLDSFIAVERKTYDSVAYVVYALPNMKEDPGSDETISP